MQARISEAGRRGSFSPPCSASAAGALQSAHRAPGGRRGCCHAPWAPSPVREHAPVVPAMIPGICPIKINMRSDLVFSGGRNRVRTCGFSLVRRNTARIVPSSPGQFMHLNCGNHARRCPKVPGVVCTVVPASGSRSSLLTPRSWSELQPWRQGYRSRTPRMAGTPVITVGLDGNHHENEHRSVTLESSRITDTGWPPAASQEHLPTLWAGGFSARPADFHRAPPAGQRGGDERPQCLRLIPAPT